MTETQSLGLGGKGPDPKPRLLRESVVIAITVLLGGLAIVAVAVASQDWEIPEYAITDENLWPYLLLVLMAMAAEIVYVPIRHGEVTEDLTFFEVLVVAATLLFAPLVALVLPLVGFIIADFLLGRPIKKTLFNVGSFALATSALVVIYGSQAAEFERFSLGWLLLVFAGVTAFTVINLFMLAWILSVEQDEENRSKSIREFVRDEWKLSFWMGAGSAASAIVLVILEVTAPVLMPLAAIPIAALWYVYKSNQLRLKEIERNKSLLELNRTLTLVDPRTQRVTPLNKLVPEAAENLRRAFLAKSQRGEEESGGAVVLVHGAVYGSFGGKDENLAAEEEMLLSKWRAEARADVTELRSELLPKRWDRGYVVQIPLDSDPNAALVIGKSWQNKGVDKVLPWSKGDWEIPKADMPILASLAASLGGAIQARNFFDEKSEEAGKLAAVVDNISDGIVLMDSEHRIQLWNSAMERIVGFAEAEVNLLDERTAELHNQLTGLTQDWAGTEPDQTDEINSYALTVRRADGESRELDVVVVQISVQRNDQDADLAYLMTVRDITKERRVERMKADFIATVSHELKTPITPIKSYSQRLLTGWETLPPDKRDRMLQTILERSDHLTRLVNDFTEVQEVSERTSATLEVNVADTSLAQLVHDTAAAFPGLAERLVVKGTDAGVRCDHDRTVQCLSNLIGNAEKYSEPSTPIKIDMNTAGDEEWGIIAVSDEGRGIPAGELDRVFEQFYRVEDPMTMTTGGSGLGLYISRVLARAMGGDISVQSTLGEGSTFVLRLPRRLEEGQHEKAPGSGR